MQGLGYFRRVVFCGYRGVRPAEPEHFNMNLMFVRLEGKSLVHPTTHYVLLTEDEEVDVPEEMEGILDDLFQAIQDKVSTPDFRFHLLKRTNSEHFSRIPLFDGQQPKVLVEFPKDFPPTFLDKCWKLS
jgi:hypothetical protein